MPNNFIHETGALPQFKLKAKIDCLAHASFSLGRLDARCMVKLEETTMTEHITTFVSQWTFENVNVETYEPSEDLIRSLVEKLIDDASEAGINIVALTETAGTPRDIVTEALSDRMEEEKERWMDKNP